MDGLPTTHEDLIFGHLHDHGRNLTTQGWGFPFVLHLALFEVENLSEKQKDCGAQLEAKERREDKFLSKNKKVVRVLST